MGSFSPYRLKASFLRGYYSICVTAFMNILIYKRSRKNYENKKNNPLRNKKLIL